MKKEENKGLQLCYLLLNENGFNSLRFKDKEGNILKQYSRFPKQRLSSFIKNNQDVAFDEWELIIKSKNSKDDFKIVGDEGSGLLITYLNSFGKYSIDYVGCGEFVYCPIIISLLRKRKLIERIENTLDMKGKLYV